MFSIGLVGGIGSGKSYIAQRLEAMGGHWIDADKIAHEVRALPEVLETLRKRWGHLGFNFDSWTEEARQVAKKIVFDTEDRSELSWLEGVINPYISDRICEQFCDAMVEDKPFVIYDVPLLLENKYKCDFLWYIDAPLELREQRAASRSRVPLTPTEIKNREAKQMPLSEKLRKSDLSIRNYGTAEEIDEQIKSALEGCTHAQAVIMERRR